MEFTPKINNNKLIFFEEKDIKLTASWNNLGYLNIPASKRASITPITNTDISFLADASSDGTDMAISIARRTISEGEIDESFFTVKINNFKLQEKIQLHELSITNNEERTETYNPNIDNENVKIKERFVGNQPTAGNSAAIVTSVENGTQKIKVGGQYTTWMGNQEERLKLILDLLKNGDLDILGGDFQTSGVDFTPGPEGQKKSPTMMVGEAFKNFLIHGQFTTSYRELFKLSKELDNMGYVLLVPKAKGLTRLIRTIGNTIYDNTDSKFKLDKGEIFGLLFDFIIVKKKIADKIVAGNLQLTESGVKDMAAHKVTVVAYNSKSEINRNEIPVLQEELVDFKTLKSSVLRNIFFRLIVLGLTLVSVTALIEPCVPK